MTELLIKTIINQAKTIQRYDTRALESLKTEQDLKERIEELEALEVFHTNKITDVSTTPEMVSKDVAITYQKELVRAEKLINELEERVGRIDELTNEVYDPRDYPEEHSE